MPIASTPRLLRRPDVLGLTGLSHASIYRDPTFPRPVKLGERASAWIEAEVRAWIEARIAERDAPRENIGARLAAARKAKRARISQAKASV